MWHVLNKSKLNLWHTQTNVPSGVVSLLLCLPSRQKGKRISMTSRFLCLSLTLPWGIAAWIIPTVLCRFYLEIALSSSIVSTFHFLTGARKISPSWLCKTLSPKASFDTETSPTDLRTNKQTECWSTGSERRFINGLWDQTGQYIWQGNIIITLQIKIN